LQQVPQYVVFKQSYKRLGHRSAHLTTSGQHTRTTNSEKQELPNVAREDALQPRPEMEMGQWVMGHGSNGSLFLDGSHGSRVTASDPWL